MPKSVSYKRHLVINVFFGNLHTWLININRAIEWCEDVNGMDLRFFSSGNRYVELQVSV